MEQKKHNIQSRKGKHLKHNERTVFLSNGTLSSTGIKKLFLWTIPSIFAFIR